jgi:acetyl-CoA C-acetyltransferase
MNREVFIVSAVRTPIGKFGGGLASLTAADLGVHAVRAVVERAFGETPPIRVPGEPASEEVKKWMAAHPARTGMRVDEVIFGNARQAGIGPNVARQIAWRSGLGDDVPAFTVNMACASGLRSIILGWRQIRSGDAEIIVAGGGESMSRVPYLMDARWGLRMGNQPLVDAMYRDGFMCPMAQMVMGETAELLAEKYKISREEQDRFALESQQRAAKAAREARFNDEIVPIGVTDKKGKTVFVNEDEHVRADTTMELLAKLPPVFGGVGKVTGTITAGNSSGITDGASAVVLVSGERVKELGLKPLARIHDATVAAVDPREMGVGPVPAIRRLEERTGWKLADYSAVELNEAFAAQVIACDRDLGFDRARLNVNGGAIALGHPIGATGARITTALVHELRRGSGASRRGLATLCVSGGMGVALALEAV